MMSWVLSINTILLLLFALPAYSNEEVYARGVVDAVLNWNLELARQRVNAWTRKDPGNHSLPLYRAIILVAEADYAEENDSEKYDKPLTALADVIKFHESYVRNNPDHFASRLSLATAKAVSGRLLMEQNRWLKAYRYGKSSRATMRQLTQENPDFEDGYLILGLFEYFTGTTPLLLRWLTHIVDFSGDREKGVEYLERCLEKGRVASPQAADALLLEVEHQPSDACRYLSLARLMVQSYPRNPRYARAQRMLDWQCQSVAPDLRREARSFKLAEPAL